MKSLRLRLQKWGGAGFYNHHGNSSHARFHERCNQPSRSVVPVVDLRLCLEMSKTEKTRNTCIVVVEVLMDNESTVIGALADSVEEVIDLEPDQIQPRPALEPTFAPTSSRAWESATTSSS